MHGAYRQVFDAIRLDVTLTIEELCRVRSFGSPFLTRLRGLGGSGGFCGRHLRVRLFFGRFRQIV